MEERRRAALLEKGIRAAMRIKDSRIGEVILKDNVKIKEQLCSEIFDIECQMQRKSEKLARARRQAFRKHREQMENGNGGVHLPPICKDQANLNAQKSLNVKKRWQQTTTKVLSSTKKDGNLKLPPLPVPRNKVDGTKDPRFAKLVSQLVPSLRELKQLSKENSKCGDDAEDSNVALKTETSSDNS